MPDSQKSPNLYRNPKLGLLSQFGFLILKPWLWIFQKKGTPASPVTLFQSYMVGDFFMALPAIKVLAQACNIQVLCRPDCLPFLSAEGIPGLPFENSFFFKPSLASFSSTFLSAWALRGKLGSIALDFDADPRSALWLKIGGVRQTVSYTRPYAYFFNSLFPIPNNILHQAEKNAAVAEGFLTSMRTNDGDLGFAKPIPIRFPVENFAPILDPTSGPWILSCFTRRDIKNWSLDQWSILLERLTAEKFPLLILDPPDGDPAFRAFKSHWSKKVGFIAGPLAQIAGYVRSSAGVITTDNFLGHMAGYFEKPVLWINGSSDSQLVQPKGPATRCVQVDPMPCRPCRHQCVHVKYKECLQALHPEEVWKAFGELRGMVGER